MKRGILIALAVLAVVTLALAQAQKAAKPGDVYAHVKYDKKAEVTVPGVIADIQHFDCPVSAAFGQHVVLKTTDGDIVVHTAPVEFMRKYGLELQVNDKVTVLGSRVKDGAGNWTIVARHVTRDNVTYRLRDEEGNPYWITKIVAAGH
jgi:hypothetical protein